MQFVTIGVLQKTIAKLIREKTVTKSTSILLASDEEGNQFHQMYSFSVDSYVFIDDDSTQGYHKEPRPAKDVTITFWPGGEEIDE
jgi:hypothetical protein